MLIASGGGGIGAAASEKREGKIKGDGTRACRLPSATRTQGGTRDGVTRAAHVWQAANMLEFWRAVRSLCWRVHCPLHGLVACADGCWQRDWRLRSQRKVLF